MTGRDGTTTPKMRYRRYWEGKRAWFSRYVFERDGTLAVVFSIRTGWLISPYEHFVRTSGGTVTPLDEWERQQGTTDDRHVPNMQ